MKKIILDTNFLIDAIKFKIDLLNELRGYEIFTISLVVDELKRILKNKKRDSKYAKNALEICSKINIFEVNGTADDVLLKMSKKYIIATHDSVLRKKIKNNNGKVAYIRQKKYILIED